MADIRDTYSVVFDAQSAIDAANKLAKAMESLGKSLTSVKTDGISKLNQAFTKLDSSAIRSSMQAVQDLENLNRSITRMSQSVPQAADIARLNQLAAQMQQLSNSMRNIGAGMQGISQFIAGISGQMNNVAQGFRQLQASVASIGTVNMGAIAGVLNNLMASFDPTLIRALHSRAVAFSQATNTAFSSVQMSLRSLTRIVDELRRMQTFATGAGSVNFGTQLRTQLIAYMRELNAITNIPIPTTHGQFAAGLTAFAQALRQALSNVTQGLQPLFTLLNSSQRAVGASAQFGANLNRVIQNINAAGSGPLAAPNAAALQRLRVVIQQLGASLNDLMSALLAINALQQTFGKNITQTGNAGAAAGQKMALSWQSVFRLFEAHVLSRSIYAFSNAVRQAIGDAATLEQKIGEVQTISQKTNSQNKPVGLTRELQDIYRDARRVAERFGFEQRDVIEAAYQAISNQVQGASESFSFLESSAKFAKAGVTTLDNAVKLLSATLHSYNLSTSQTDRVAASFFKTIELGRLRAADLADDIGRSAVIADQLGISLDELNAAFATSTIQGIKFRNAQTYINNIMQKMIKPTEEMKKALSELGVSSGEAGVKVYGFMGFMEKLYQLAADMPDTMGELGKLFSTIRGITGAAIFKDTVALYEENLNKIRNSQESYLIAYQTMMANSGDKFLREMNKIKTYFTGDYGKKIFENLLWFTDNRFLGGLANTVKWLVIIGSSILGIVTISKSLKFVAAAMDAWRGATAAAAAATAAYTVEVNGATVATVRLSAAQKAAQASSLAGSVSKWGALLAGGAGVLGAIAGALMIALPLASKLTSIGSMSEETYQENYNKLKEDAEKVTLLRTKLVGQQITTLDVIAKSVYQHGAQAIAEQMRVVRQRTSGTIEVFKDLNDAFEYSTRSTKTNIHQQQGVYEGFKRVLDGVLTSTQRMGKEFRSNIADLVQNLTKLETFRGNMDRAIQTYETGVREAGLTGLSGAEKQDLFEKEGQTAFERGKVQYSEGRINLAQKSFESALAYFTKAREAYVETMKSFGMDADFIPIDVNEYLDKIKPIKDFLVQMTDKTIDIQREQVLEQFSKIQEKLFYEVGKMQGKAFIDAFNLVISDQSEVKLKEPEFAELAAQRLLTLSNELEQNLPRELEALQADYAAGLKTTIEYKKGIEDIERHIVDAANEEKQITDEIITKQKDLNQLRSDGAAIFRDLLKDANELLRSRKEAGDLKSQFAADKGLLDLENKFRMAGTSGVGEVINKDFAKYLEDEANSFAAIRDRQQQILNDTKASLFSSGSEKTDFEKLESLLRERDTLQQRYLKLKFSDREEDKKQLGDDKEKLKTIQTELSQLERRNILLRDAGEKVRALISAEKGVKANIERQGMFATTGDAGVVMAESLRKISEDFATESILAEQQKALQTSYENVGNEFKSLEDSATELTQMETGLANQIGGVLAAFKTGQYDRFLGRETPKEVERAILTRPSGAMTGGDIIIEQQMRARELATAQRNYNIDFLNQQLSLLQAKSQEVRTKAAAELTEYLNGILAKTDIDAGGKIRATQQSIRGVTVNFSDLTDTLTKLKEQTRDKGIDLTDVVSNWTDMFMKSFETPLAAGERLTYLGTGKNNLEEVAQLLRNNSLAVPAEITKAIEQIDLLITYFQKEQRDTGAFKFTDELAKVLENFRVKVDGTYKNAEGKNISKYEYVSVEGNKALENIRKAGVDVVKEFNERARQLGLNMTPFGSIDDIRRALTSQDLTTQVNLKQIFGTFGDTAQEQLGVQRSTLVVLQGIHATLAKDRATPAEITKESVPGTPGGAMVVPPQVAKAVGGTVPNTPNLSKPFGTDSVLAALTPGEFVVRKEAVQALGIPYLEMLNNYGHIQKHAKGGAVSAKQMKAMGLNSEILLKAQQELLAQYFSTETAEARKAYVSARTGDNGALGKAVERYFEANSDQLRERYNAMLDEAGIKKGNFAKLVSVAVEGGQTGGQYGLDLVLRTARGETTQNLKILTKANPYLALSRTGANQQRPVEAGMAVWNLTIGPHDDIHLRGQSFENPVHPENLEFYRDLRAPEFATARGVLREYDALEKLKGAGETHARTIRAGKEVTRPISKLQKDLTISGKEALGFLATSPDTASGPIRVVGASNWPVEVRSIRNQQTVPPEIRDDPDKVEEYLSSLKRAERAKTFAEDRAAFIEKLRSYALDPATGKGDSIARQAAGKSLSAIAQRMMSAEGEFLFSRTDPFLSTDTSGRIREIFGTLAVREPATFERYLDRFLNPSTRVATLSEASRIVRPYGVEPFETTKLAPGAGQSIQERIQALGKEYFQQQGVINRAVKGGELDFAEWLLKNPHEIPKFGGNTGLRNAQAALDAVRAKYNSGAAHLGVVGALGTASMLAPAILQGIASWDKGRNISLGERAKEALFGTAMGTALMPAFSKYLGQLGNIALGSWQLVNQYLAIRNTPADQQIDLKTFKEKAANLGLEVGQLGAVIGGSIGAYKGLSFAGSKALTTLGATDGAAAALGAGSLRVGAKLIPIAGLLYTVGELAAGVARLSDSVEYGGKGMQKFSGAQIKEEMGNVPWYKVWDSKWAEYQKNNWSLVGRMFGLMAQGGTVPNTPNMSPIGTDSVLAALTPGEFVVNRRSAQALGYGFLQSLNRYAEGGVVGSMDEYWRKKIEEWKSITPTGPIHAKAIQKNIEMAEDILAVPARNAAIRAAKKAMDAAGVAETTATAAATTAEAAKTTTKVLSLKGEETRYDQVLAKNENLSAQDRFITLLYAIYNTKDTGQMLQAIRQDEKLKDSKTVEDAIKTYYGLTSNDPADMVNAIVQRLHEYAGSGKKFEERTRVGLSGKKHTAKYGFAEEKMLQSDILNRWAYYQQDLLNERASGAKQTSKTADVVAAAASAPATTAANVAEAAKAPQTTVQQAPKATLAELRKRAAEADEASLVQAAATINPSLYNNDTGEWNESAKSSYNKAALEVLANKYPASVYPQVLNHPDLFSPTPVESGFISVGKFRIQLKPGQQVAISPEELQSRMRSMVASSEKWQKVMEPMMRFSQFFKGLPLSAFEELAMSGKPGAYDRNIKRGATGYKANGPAAPGTVAWWQQNAGNAAGSVEWWQQNAGNAADSVEWWQQQQSINPLAGSVDWWNNPAAMAQYTAGKRGLPKKRRNRSGNINISNEQYRDLQNMTSEDYYAKYYPNVSFANTPGSRVAESTSIIPLEERSKRLAGSKGKILALRGTGYYPKTMLTSEQREAMIAELNPEPTMTSEQLSASIDGMKGEITSQGKEVLTDSYDLLKDISMKIRVAELRLARQQNNGMDTGTTERHLEWLRKKEEDLKALGKFAEGGHVSGPGRVSGFGSDTVPALLTPGEYVINAQSTSIFRPLLEYINGYAKGGIVMDDPYKQWLRQQQATKTSKKKDVLTAVSLMDQKLHSKKKDVRKAQIDAAKGMRSIRSSVDQAELEAIKRYGKVSPTVIGTLQSNIDARRKKQLAWGGRRYASGGLVDMLTPTEMYYWYMSNGQTQMAEQELYKQERNYYKTNKLYDPITGENWGMKNPYVQPTSRTPDLSILSSFNSIGGTQLPNGEWNNYGHGMPPNVGMYGSGYDPRGYWNNGDWISIDTGQVSNYWQQDPSISVNYREPSQADLNKLDGEYWRRTNPEAWAKQQDFYTKHGWEYIGDGKWKPKAGYTKVPSEAGGIIDTYQAPAQDTSFSYKNQTLNRNLASFNSQISAALQRSVSGQFMAAGGLDFAAIQAGMISKADVARQNRATMERGLAPLKPTREFTEYLNKHENTSMADSVLYGSLSKELSEPETDLERLLRRNKLRYSGIGNMSAFEGLNSSKASGLNGFYIGGVRRFAEGGLVPGTLTGVDSVPALLTPGEFVFNKDAVSNIGYSILDGLNSGLSWFNIRQSFSKDLPGSSREATRINLTDSDKSNKSESNRVTITAHDLNATPVVNRVYDVLRRELRGMKVERSFLPY